MKNLLVTLTVAILLVCYASATGMNGKKGIRMQRLPHKLVKTNKLEDLNLPPFYNKYRSPSGNGFVGSTINMKGGLLTLGTYYTTVEIGTPPVNFTVLLDTGSSNLAVPAVGCTSCGTSPLYDPSKSSSYIPINCTSFLCQSCSPLNYFNDPTRCIFGQPFCSTERKTTCGQAITYGGGSSGLQNDLAFEKVCLAGYCVQQHNFGLIEAQFPAQSFSNPPIDGIIGFAYEYNACNPTCTTPIFDDIVRTQKINNLFAVCLTESNGGIVDMGIVDDSKYEGQLQYTPITHESWYNIDILDIQIGNHSIGVAPFFYQKTNDVIGSFVDTGTSLMLTGPVIYAGIVDTFQKYYSNLPGVTNAFFNPNVGCISDQEMGNSLSSFPIISVEFPGDENQPSFTVDVPATSYLIHSNGQYCMGIASGFSLGVVLGDVFMIPNYIVFDKQNSRLGFAKVKNCVP